MILKNSFDKFPTNYWFRFTPGEVSAQISREKLTEYVVEEFWLQTASRGPLLFVEHSDLNRFVVERVYVHVGENANSECWNEYVNIENIRNEHEAVALYNEKCKRQTLSPSTATVKIEGGSHATSYVPPTTTARPPPPPPTPTAADHANSAGGATSQVAPTFAHTPMPTPPTARLTFKVAPTLAPEERPLSSVKNVNNKFDVCTNESSTAQHMMLAQCDASIVACLEAAEDLDWLVSISLFFQKKKSSF